MPGGEIRVIAACIIRIICGSRIHIPGYRYQSKSIQIDTPLRSNAAVELADRTAAQITGVLIFCICFGYRSIDLFKIGVSYDRLATQDETAFIGYFERQILKCPGIGGNDLTNLPVASVTALTSSPLS